MFGVWLCLWRVFGWVGCVVDRIVGASVFCVCGLCWSISASRLVALAGCLRLVYLPSGLLGTFQPPPWGGCGDLVLKLVSRLDAFSGYPSRT